MIDKRCVLRMKIPYPSVDSSLAVQAHMYICKDADTPIFKFVKCQTLEPYMLGDTRFKHFCDEIPNVDRNPFIRTTRIDCDKLFFTNSVEYSDSLLTTIRKDICTDLYNAVLSELSADGYENIHIDEDNLMSLNSEIVRIST